MAKTPLSKRTYVKAELLEIKTKGINGITKITFGSFLSVTFQM